MSQLFLCSGPEFTEHAPTLFYGGLHPSTDLFYGGGSTLAPALFYEGT